MSQPVLIFGPARTGSSFIVNTLRSHPDVLAHGEPFQTEHLDWHFDSRVLPLADFALRDRAPYQFIRWVFLQSLGHEFVVLKVLFGQNDETLWRLLREFDIRIAYLCRPNRLAHFASFGLAYRTNVWNAHRGETVPQDEQLRFDPKEFEKFTSWLDRCERRVESIRLETGRQFLVCNYDALDMAANTTKIASWLGLDQRGLVESSLVRMRSTPIIERFSNPGEVMKALTELNRLEWLKE